ncbi:hypothetical protein WCX18_01320 [Sulfurimonas sp. HSL1-2]|uniref:hypothetical protein n=1 Tax=Thiomicrolovo zhangzhouensis TaxID=3131933 RepID=UPI0031F8287A
MCFVVFIVIGAFALSLWTHGQLLYAAAAGAVSLFFLFFSIRKIIKNGPCLFGKRRDC